MAEKITKMEFMKKKEINFNENNTSDRARKIIESVGDEDKLILRITINPPVFIEDAAPLNPEGILSICKEN